MFGNAVCFQRLHIDVVLVDFSKAFQRAPHFKGLCKTPVLHCK